MRVPYWVGVLVTMLLGAALLVTLGQFLSFWVAVAIGFPLSVLIGVLVGRAFALRDNKRDEQD